MGDGQREMPALCRFTRTSCSSRERGGPLAGSVYRRVRGEARKAVLTPYEYTSPAGKRVYGCRHTCLTGWLNAGIPPARVAEWAGDSVAVLLASYARCITGQLANYQKQIGAVHPVTARVVPLSPFAALLSARCGPAPLGSVV